MHKLISELRRLYFLDDQHYAAADADGTSAGPLPASLLENHLRGDATLSIRLATDDGHVRALIIDFLGNSETQRAQRWDTLCAVANSLQADLGLPAPAVSISGADGYGLWLSLETPVALAQAQEFLQLLHGAYFPGLEADEVKLRPDSADSHVELPPCLNLSTQKWSAFINPGMGASFAGEPGLEMPPPPAAQAAFLEGLQGIAATQFAQAMRTLRQKHAVAPPSPAPTTPGVHAALPAGLLLKDATLEEIVKLLHERNIEPTFRHLIVK